MFRPLTLCLLLLAGFAVFAATTVIIDGKTVTVPTIEQNGKAFVDIVALMKLLGGTATFDPATHKVVIDSDGAPSAGPLAGDNGELNKVYALVKSNPIQFSLLRAEYTTTPITIGDKYFAPKAEEKLLVLHFTVQNTQAATNFVRYDRLRFTAVDAMNVNHEAVQGWGDAENHAFVALELKPKQKLECYAGILVPAKGVVPKLMIMPIKEGDGPILRYDLRDKVAALPAPIADPADPTGATALENVPGELGKTYPYATFEITVEQFSYVDTKLSDITPSAGGRLLIANLRVKNIVSVDSLLRYDMFRPVAVDADGAEVRYRGMLLPSSEVKVAQPLKPGAEMRVRMIFAVEKGRTPVKFSLNENAKTRNYEYAIP